MPLIDIWKADKNSVLQMTIEQIASIAGDGKLLDNSVCQAEIRAYLNEASTDSLEEYANYCLENAFAKSGQVLQDVVNELGRRLEYEVENGRYQGVKNAIGYDGIWRDEQLRTLVIEVKTTDAYRLSLDVLANYRQALIREKRISEDSSILIVVGRTDTGELEAQVRGSKHAWYMRIIGIDSLVKLVRVKEAAESQDTIRKIRTLLAPLEYTRIDELVSIVFAATKDIEDTSDDVATSNPSEGESIGFTNSKTPAEEILEIRNAIVNATSTRMGVSLIKKTRAMFWSPNHDARLACTISKRYEGKGAARYWYAFHPLWNQFLEEGQASFLALGCVDLEFAFLVPLKKIKALLPYLNKTEIEGGKYYWHLKILDSDKQKYFLQVPQPGKDFEITDYKLELK